MYVYSYPQLLSICRQSVKTGPEANSLSQKSQRTRADEGQLNSRVCHRQEKAKKESENQRDISASQDGAFSPRRRVEKGRETLPAKTRTSERMVVDADDGWCLHCHDEACLKAAPVIWLYGPYLGAFEIVPLKESIELPDLNRHSYRDEKGPGISGRKGCQLFKSTQLQLLPRFISFLFNTQLRNEVQRRHINRKLPFREPIAKKNIPSGPIFSQHGFGNLRIKFSAFSAPDGIGRVK
ncbi:hypothetical protein CISG_06535 [Coccidioides immitis RMSCC 3703]|uniref:Uncharacterized protein n=2 Tax=Coccidioides immitis TaxID=5501 RepID=A0A0J8R1T4_COCIT|nr:hypothetical protein CIRG_05913 [Coccidioides immitis RMSCC 2394]KMU78300.1 hypothetical protein CISG_06535 [Coccidioides immitis RMSCC 3703]